MAVRAPKQWSLTKKETITSFEAWRQNIQYTLSLDPNFATYLVDDYTWERKTSANPLRGFTDDAEEAPNRRTAAQKVTQLELMLGQIANFCPVISRNTIVKNSSSVRGIWQSIRLHYGFQSSGAHFLDFNNIRLEHDERPEDLFQRLTSFVEDNLLRSDGTIQHHGEIPAENEDLTPSLENLIVLTWLRLIHNDLPALVKQRYGTELRSQTLASLKPEISQALDSLLEEVQATADARVLRTAFNKSKSSSRIRPESRKKPQSCILCKQANRPYQHFLSKCKYLPDEDRLFMTKVRHLSSLDIDTDQDSDDDITLPTRENSVDRVVSTTRRVITKQSPTLRVFHKHHPLTLTLDTGAEISMVKSSVAKQIGAKISKSNQTALQADGVTPLEILGETHLTLSRGSCSLKLEALVVSDLDVDVLAGIPFMTVNDISVRPAKHQISIRDRDTVTYGPSSPDTPEHHVRRTQAFTIKTDLPATVIWPGSYIEVDIPTDIHPDSSLAVEPKSEDRNSSWIHPHITESVGGKLRLVNDSSHPQRIRRHEHLCQVRLTSEIPSEVACDTPPTKPNRVHNVSHLHSDSVTLDPDNVLSPDNRSKFRQLLKDNDEVFNTQFQGYNGAVGPFQATVNMGSEQPPQRKGRVPQYARDKLVELQEQFDDLETKGVVRKPEDIGVNVEYVNPSFLVKKPSGGHRLVTAFSDVGRYSKPQPSLMPDVDSTLRTIAPWKYIIVTDLTSAFYQIPLSKQSMKYCGVVTPFRGVRVYTRCAMGMPGSETALEELMCRVLGDLLQEGYVAKLADDLYCGADTPDELLVRWSRVLDALRQSGLCLSASKTVIAPRTATILGWSWSYGNIAASPHRISVLNSCPQPETVRGLRSFIGAYKVLSRVMPNCSQYISPLEDHIAGLASSDKVKWSDDVSQAFAKAQKALTDNKTIALPCPTDRLWIVTDASVKQRGLGATLYVTRNDKLKLAGFFSAKLRKHQVTWLPCEVEALCIAAAVKHFSPFIIQSVHTTCVLTDSKPCVQALEKLCRGEFSASPRVTTFLSTASRCQISVRHLAGSDNVPTDFASRNAPVCNDPKCQVCSFIAETEDSVVRATSSKDIISSMTRLPFTTRSAWLSVQSECPDLRRTHAHLKQGTRPSKKLTNLKDIKRYLGVASIAKDGLLVVRKHDPLSSPTELIIVPRSVLDGLVMALHIKLDHPPKTQLERVLKRHFFALDMHKSVELVTEACHTCAALNKVPGSLLKQTSEDPPETVCAAFAADVLRRNRQFILVVRETVTSFTAACLIKDEKHDTMRNGLIQLVVSLHPLDGPPAVIRVDPAPGFVALQNDETLKSYILALDIGRIKNVNKNPVAEKAIAELETEILRQNPGGDTLSDMALSVSVARLNSRIRYSGLSAREMFTQRNQFTNEQLPLADRDIIVSKHKQRLDNHTYSEKSKLKNKVIRGDPDIDVGSLVYLYSDRNKSQSRNRYLVVSVDGEWCFIKKFSGNQLRANSYKVKTCECYRVPYSSIWHDSTTRYQPRSDDEVDDDTPVSSNTTHPLCSTDLTSQTPDIGEEMPLLIGENTDTDSPSGDSVVPSVPDIPTDILARPRPQRNRHPPAYLKDYICDK